MDGFKKFLESSTIHGLGYISTTRRLVKLFWILVVIGGFTGAGVLIYQSFQSWDESPVKTTIETLPITELRLPKVTVCPPKNTFTNLNYDLMMTENMTLDDVERSELTQYAVGLIQESVHKTVMKNLSLIEEQNRYYNWYFGLTNIDLPYWGQNSPCTDSADKDCAEHKLRQFVLTKATSGIISTQYFGDNFDTNKIQEHFRYAINIGPPLQQKDNPNITLYIEVEKNILGTFDTFFSSSEDSVTTLLKELSPPKSGHSYLLSRKISPEEINELQENLMPGFRLKWYYNEVLYPDKFQSVSIYQFSRYNTVSIFPFNF